MGDAKVRTMDVASPTETIATSRKSGWFQFTDLDKKALIRRINARYNSGKDITIKLYADGDIVNPAFTGIMPKNGDTGATLSSSINNSDTTLNVSSTSEITSLDKILINREIMQVEDLLTNQYFTTDTENWGTDSTGTLSVANERMVLTSGNSGSATHARAFQSFTTVVGKVYRVTGNFYKGTADQGQVHIGDESYFDGNYRANTSTMASDTAFDFTFTATQTTHHILLHEGSTQTVGDTTIWDNISIICTTQLKVSRGQTNTQAESHTSGSKIFYGHKKWDSLRVGKRAKYAKVEISTAAGTTSTEINKLEIEYK